MSIRVITRSTDITVDDITNTRRRLRFALGRLAPRIERITVRLSDMNGPRGGIDKRCRVSIKTREHGTIVAEDDNAILDAAIYRAVERASRAVVRAVGKARAVERRSA